MSDQENRTGRKRRAPAPAAVPRPSATWASALTRIAPNEVDIRGYPVDEMMGRVSFAEAIYLLLRGELPSRDIGKLFGAVLVASIDHGVTPPSTQVARQVAATRAPLGSSVAAGVLGFGPLHGGDIESCLRFLQRGLEIHRSGSSYEVAAGQVLAIWSGQTPTPPGFGHRLHTRDPRAARLLQMAHELDLDDEHCRMLRVVERVLNADPARADQPVPINVDGAVAAICGDLGFDPEIANGVFIIARVPGLLAHAAEERMREAPLRQVNAKDHQYDGPRRRRLPETRK
ncbi:MAG: citryl-CoA lyase [Acidobacteriota bacterium]